MNIIHGAFASASLNNSLTLDAPTPTNISTKLEPDNEKNGTFASPATALAISVFPVPGGPTNNAPFGSFAPISVYLAGQFKKSITSSNDSLASSCPATSLNVTPISFSTYTLALFLPMEPIPPPILPILLKTIFHIKNKSNSGIAIEIKLSNKTDSFGFVP